MDQVCRRVEGVFGEWLLLGQSCLVVTDDTQTRLEREEEQLVSLKKERAEVVMIDRVDFEEELLSR